MSNDFTTVTKYLRLRKASATSPSFPSGDNRLAKYGTLVKASAVEPLQMQLVIPSISYADASLPSFGAHTIVAQHNYAVSAPFVLTDLQIVNNSVTLPLRYAAIRWQEDGVWYRYIINAALTPTYSSNKIPVPLYNYQKIGANFAIEIYNLFNFTHLAYPSRSQES